MLSRVANALYWMSRYIERADNVARFMDVNHHLLLDLPVGANEQWEPLVVVTGDNKAFKKRYDSASRENVIHFLTFDTENPNSIRASLRAARENARSVREIISTDMWTQLNKVYLQVEDVARAPRNYDAPHEFFESIRAGSAMFAGVTDTTMTHGAGWQFMRLGRLLERADKTTRILDVKYFILLPDIADVGSPYDNLQWAALLRSASAFEMYRQRHGRIAPNRVVQFLLLDRQFPRAVAFCLTKANESLHLITGSPLGTFQNPAERQLGALQSEMAYGDADDIIASGLHEFIDQFQVRLNRCGIAIRDTFFAMRSIRDAAAETRGRDMMTSQGQYQ